jgi:hypothetical protein
MAKKCINQAQIQLLRGKSIVDIGTDSALYLLVTREIFSIFRPWYGKNTDWGLALLGF